MKLKKAIASATLLSALFLGVGSILDLDASKARRADFAPLFGKLSKNMSTSHKSVSNIPVNCISEYKACLPTCQKDSGFSSSCQTCWSAVRSCATKSKG